ncbi:MAG: helix-hairpin-helix domain-containing protein [Candidatus Omnitrophota bacterium]
MKKGFVLIVVLWMMTIFAVLSASLAYRARIYLKLVKYQIAAFENLSCARESLNYAVLTLIDDNYNYDERGDNWNSIDYEPADSSDIRITVIDENRKVNINTAADNLLAGLVHLDTELVKKIIENRPYLRIEELLCVEGITNEIYYGREDLGIVGLKDLITVYSNGKININTAEGNVLKCIPSIDVTTVDIILNYCAVDKFEQENALTQDLINLGVRPEIASQIIGFLTVGSDVYKIEIEAVHKKYKMHNKIGVVINRAPKEIKIILWEER